MTLISISAMRMRGLRGGTNNEIILDFEMIAIIMELKIPI